MTPGTLFFDTAFVFRDGGHGQKILVTLGGGQGITVVVKTTSQGRRYHNHPGCQVADRFPNFYLHLGSCCLTKPTWICLDEFYEFKDSELLQRHFDGQIKRIGELSDTETLELLPLRIAESAPANKDLMVRRLRASSLSNAPAVSLFIVAAAVIELSA